MYELYRQLQEEVFSMLPMSRRDNPYCRRLDDLKIKISDIAPTNEDRKFNIDKHYNKIIAWLSQTDSTGAYVNKKEDHPKGFKCGYDHNTARYCWVNFIPAVFNTRKNGIYTIEFRPMQASTSYRKIKNWLLICFALVDIIENHKQVLYADSNIDLATIVKICYPKEDQHKALVEYIRERKQKFLKDSASLETQDYQDNEVDNNFKMKSL